MLFPGLCVKVRTTDGKKLFLNLCQTDEVPPPEEISEDQLIKLWTGAEDSDYRVPMSIGQLKNEVDTSNFFYLLSIYIYYVMLGLRLLHKF